MNMFQSLTIYLILLLSGGYAFGAYSVNGDCDVTITYPTYTLCYDNIHKSPLFASYSVTPAMINAPILKGRPKFHQDKNIDKQYRVSNKDYKTSNLYDKGHLAPNSALNYSKSAQRQTFSLANTAPQIKAFNRRLWAKIERSVRLLGKTEVVGVVTGVCFNSDPETLGNGVSIPEAFFKLVQYDNKYSLYYVENTDHQDMTLGLYQVTVEDFNALCNTVVIR